MSRRAWALSSLSSSTIAIAFAFRCYAERARRPAAAPEVARPSPIKKSLLSPLGRIRLLELAAQGRKKALAVPPWLTAFTRNRASVPPARMPCNGSARHGLVANPRDMPASVQPCCSEGNRRRCALETLPAKGPFSEKHTSASRCLRLSICARKYSALSSHSASSIKTFHEFQANKEARSNERASSLCDVFAFETTQRQLRWPRRQLPQRERLPQQEPQRQPWRLRPRPSWRTQQHA